MKEFNFNKNVSFCLENFLLCFRNPSEDFGRTENFSNFLYKEKELGERRKKK